MLDNLGAAVASCWCQWATIVVLIIFIEFHGAIVIVVVVERSGDWWWELDLGTDKKVDKELCDTRVSEWVRMRMSNKAAGVLYLLHEFAGVSNA